MLRFVESAARKKPARHPIKGINEIVHPSPRGLLKGNGKVTATPSSAVSVITRFPGVVHGWKNRLSGACSQHKVYTEVVGWYQEVWGAISCHKDEQRACEHDLPAKVSLLDRYHNNDSLGITALK